MQLYHLEADKLSTFLLTAFCERFMNAGTLVVQSQLQNFKHFVQHGQGSISSVVAPCVADCCETIKLDIAFRLFIEH